MKKILFLLVIMLVMSGCSVLNQDNNTTENVEVTQNKSIEDWTILDYYLALPDDYIFDYFETHGFEYEQVIPSQDRQKYIEILDEENSYLKLKDKKQNGENQQFVMKEFLTPEGEKIFAFDNTQATPLVVFQDLLFRKYKDGEWIHVTDEVIANVWEEIDLKVREDLKKKGFAKTNDDVEVMIVDLKMILPQQGTTMLYGDESEEEYLYKIEWKGGEFKLEDY